MNTHTYYSKPTSNYQIPPAKKQIIRQAIAAVNTPAAQLLHRRQGGTLATYRLQCIQRATVKTGKFEWQPTYTLVEWCIRECIPDIALAAYAATCIPRVKDGYTHILGARHPEIPQQAKNRLDELPFNYGSAGKHRAQD